MIAAMKAAAIRFLALCVGLLIGFGITSAIVPRGMTFHGEVPVMSDIDRLFESGECWTGEAPADVTIPTHVVIRKVPDSELTYAGPRWTGRALEQTFGVRDHGIAQIVGFCR